MKRAHILLIAILMVTSNFVNVRAQNGSNGQSFVMDTLGYNISFRLSDGTEILQIQSMLRVIYVYQHHQPTISQHTLTGFFGFYYGKTAIGRSILREVKVTRFEFRPQWHDSVGIFHDADLVEPLVSIEETIPDGYLAGGQLLMDDNAVSRYLPDFGGKFVFDNLVFVLEDGREITVTNDTMEIVIEKSINRLSAENAEVVHGENLTYSADYNAVTFSLQASAPAVVLVDFILAIVIISSIGALFVSVVARRKGVDVPRILHRFGVFRRSANNGS